MPQSRFISISKEEWGWVRNYYREKGCSLEQIDLWLLKNGLCSSSRITSPQWRKHYSLEQAHATMASLALKWALAPSPSPLRIKIPPILHKG